MAEDPTSPSGSSTTPNPAIRVAIVDDHEMVRNGLRAILDVTEDMTVVGEAESVTSARAMLLARRPDVALIDIQLPDGSGLDICRTLREQAPEVACLVLTSVSYDEAVIEAVEAGAAGYVLKQVRSGALLSYIRRVAAGESILDARSAREVDRRASSGEADPLIGSLSNQERRLLELVSRGLSNRQIAAEMCLAEKTVKNYVSNMLSKLGLSRRSEAAALGARVEERRRAVGPGPSGDPVRY